MSTIGLRHATSSCDGYALCTWVSVQLLSRVWLCDPMNCSTTGLPVHHQLPEFTQIHVHWVSDAIQSFHPLLSTSPPALNLSQHQGLFQWVSSSDQVAKVLEFQLQHQSFQLIFRTDFLWASLVAQRFKRLPGMWKTWVRSLGWEDPLEKGKATHSSILGLPLWLSW